jgi:hypothetical protein
MPMQCPSCGLQIDQPNLERCPRCGLPLATTSTQTPQAAPPQNPYGPFQPYSGYAPPDGYSQPYQFYGRPPVAPVFPPPGYPQSAQAPALARKQPRTKLIVGIIAAVVVVLAGCSWGIFATVQALHLPTHSAVPRETPVPILDNNFSSGDVGWSENSYCFLKGDGYHISKNYICLAPIANISDVDIKAQVKQINGPANYPRGIVFRFVRSDTSYDAYVFVITSDGRWAFEKCSGGSCDRLVNFRSNSAVHTGLDVDNTLEVYAKGSHVDLFVNGTAVGSIDDSAYSFGKVGLICGEFSECVFTNLTIGEID